MNILTSGVRQDKLGTVHICAEHSVQSWSYCFSNNPRLTTRTMVKHHSPKDTVDPTLNGFADSSWMVHSMILNKITVPGLHE